MKIFGVLIFLLPFLELCSSVSIECNYGYEYRFYLGNVFECLVVNDLDITSLDVAEIKNVTHHYAHDYEENNDEVESIMIINKNVKYFPQGLEKFLKNLKRIGIKNGRVKEIHQSDLKPFPGLMNFDLHENDIEVLEEGLFHFNPKLGHISFTNNKIIKIDPNVFDDLKHLSWLWLSGNTCIDEYAENDHESVKRVIQSIKEKCKNLPSSTSTMSSTLASPESTTTTQKSASDSSVSKESADSFNEDMKVIQHLFASIIQLILDGNQSIKLEISEKFKNLENVCKAKEVSETATQQKLEAIELSMKRFRYLILQNVNLTSFNLV